MTKIRSNILNPLSPDEFQLFPDQVLGFQDGKIAFLRPYDADLDTDAEDALDCLIMPGLIDLHVHLGQYYARGHSEPGLLPWLTKHIYPAEARCQEPGFASQISRDFFRALHAAGTSTAVIYTAPFAQACEIAFETAQELGSRALIGMTMMDMNAPPELLQSTAYAFENSLRLYELFKDASPLLHYVFTPRFAPTCSKELLRLIAGFAANENAYIQSHLAENKDEIAWVKELFDKPSYTQVYADYGILSPHTIMAHAIHLQDDELRLLKETDTAIAHCPESNFMLKSGEFAYQRLWEMGLRIALGSDMAAGSSLNMLYQAKMADYRQSILKLSGARLLWHITLGAAHALGWQHQIGSLEIGKEADLCMIRIPKQMPLDETLVGRLFYLANEFEIRRTYVCGRIVFESHKNTNLALEG